MHMVLVSRENNMLQAFITGQASSGSIRSKPTQFCIIFRRAQVETLPSTFRKCKEAVHATYAVIV